ncbi:MAG: phosphoribosylglycinamide formyltransferase [Chitinispirillaceae bacterium]|nr:phosphoribosylglycinamide formyltransferase [Chitinispirillaceae bacterium]
MMRCAVFASGGGSNFQALLDRKGAGDLHVEIAVLVVNNSSVGAVERAKKNSISVVHCAPSQFETEERYVESLRGHLQHYGVELIVCAGYMKKIPSPVVHAYRNRILNIHPGLLPAFGGKGMYGERVHKAVLEYGAKISGITVHFIDDEYDHGPIIMQRAVPVRDGDTPEKLAARVLKAEHAHYWRAVEAVGSGRIRIEGRRVVGRI